MRSAATRNGVPANPFPNSLNFFPTCGVQGRDRVRFRTVYALWPGRFVTPWTPAKLRVECRC